MKRKRTGLRNFLTNSVSLSLGTYFIYLYGKSSRRKRRRMGKKEGVVVVEELCDQNMKRKKPHRDVGVELTSLERRLRCMRDG